MIVVVVFVFVFVSPSHADTGVGSSIGPPSWARAAEERGRLEAIAVGDEVAARPLTKKCRPER